MIRKYDNHKLQTNPWYGEEEPHNNHETPGKQTKQNNQLSLFPINIEQLQTHTMGVTINNKSTTIETLPKYRQQPKPPGRGEGGRGLNAFSGTKYSPLNSAVFEVQ